MSGGRYDYAYRRVREMADDLRDQLRNPIRKAFATYLHQVAAVMKDVEWHDSGDLSESDDAIRALIEPPPVPLLLYCPRCALQHVDQPQPEKQWTNPPHRSHECQGCGHVWRPADVATTGVAEISTRGSRDGSAVPTSTPMGAALAIRALTDCGPAAYRAGLRDAARSLRERARQGQLSDIRTELQRQADALEAKACATDQVAPSGSEDSRE